MELKLFSLILSNGSGTVPSFRSSVVAFSGIVSLVSGLSICCWCWSEGPSELHTLHRIPARFSPSPFSGFCCRSRVASQVSWDGVACFDVPVPGLNFRGMGVHLENVDFAVACGCPWSCLEMEIDRCHGTCSLCFHGRRGSYG